MRLALTSVTLFGFWLVLSGHYTPFLMIAGAACSVAIVAFCQFKGITDAEGFPIEKLPRALVYWPWLGWQIVLSGWNVSKLILDPKLPISPSMVKVTTLQKSAVGLTTYANSITLTPGTISVEVSERGKAIWVHAITKENAEGFADDEMNRRVAVMDGADPAGKAGATRTTAKSAAKPVAEAKA